MELEHYQPTDYSGIVASNAIEQLGTAGLSFSSFLRAEPATPKAKLNATNGISTEAMPASIMSNWTTLARSDLPLPMFHRLIKLASLPDDWRSSGTKRLSDASLHHFLNFWKQTLGEANEPFLGLTPDGNVFAEWHRTWQRHLDIEFRADGRAYFGLFDTRDEMQGINHNRDLLRLLLTHPRRPLKWTNG